MVIEIEPNKVTYDCQLCKIVKFLIWFYNAIFFSFCQSKSPDITVSKEDITILFTSDHEETGGGAQCTAECVEGWVEATKLQSSGNVVNVKY